MHNWVVYLFPKKGSRTVVVKLPKWEIKKIPKCFAKVKSWFEINVLERRVVTIDLQKRRLEIYKKGVRVLEITWSKLGIERVIFDTYALLGDKFWIEEDGNLPLGKAVLKQLEHLPTLLEKVEDEDFLVEFLRFLSRISNIYLELKELLVSLEELLV